MAKNALDWIAIILLIIGGINWGLVALGWNLVEAVFGAVPILLKIIYGLVGLSALYQIYVVAAKK